MADAKSLKPNILKVNNPDDLAQKAYEIFIADSLKAIEEKGAFFVAVSGGHTPIKLFKHLTDAKNHPWEKIHLFWVDERYVPPSDDNSNYHLAKETFLDTVPIPESNIHRIPTEASNFQLAAAQYEHTIRSVFNIKPNEIPQFDLMILGMGADGHIGSLFPNTYNAFETEHLASVVYVMDDKLNRITLTYPVMKESKHIMVLLEGSSKAQAVKEIFTTEPDEVKYPVHSLWPILDKVTWLIDKDAAKHL